jgi:hypothetical protein
MSWANTASTTIERTGSEVHEVDVEVAVRLRFACAPAACVHAWSAGFCFASHSVGLESSTETERGHLSVASHSAAEAD